MKLDTKYMLEQYKFAHAYILQPCQTANAVQGTWLKNKVSTKLNKTTEYLFQKNYGRLPTWC